MYKDNWFNLEKVIYSSTGKWGVMISHEDHAVIGCSKEESFCANDLD